MIIVKKHPLIWAGVQNVQRHFEIDASWPWTNATPITEARQRYRSPWHHLLILPKVGYPCINLDKLLASLIVILLVYRDLQANSFASVSQYSQELNQDAELPSYLNNPFNQVVTGAGEIFQNDDFEANASVQNNVLFGHQLPWPIEGLAEEPSMPAFSDAVGSVTDSSRTQTSTSLRYGTDSPLEPTDGSPLAQSLFAGPSHSPVEPQRGILRVSPQATPAAQGCLPRRKSWYSRNQGVPMSSPRYIPSGFAVSSPATPTFMDPMQRWRDSPPEDEPASLSAIRDALQSLPARPNSGQSAKRRSMNRRGASTTSLDSGGNNSSTTASSVVSAASSQGPSIRGLRSTGRVAKARKPTDSTKDARPFHCTFCCDRFKTKYDWTRHEKSLHFSMESWVCAPHGGLFKSSETGKDHCVYCHQLEPSLEHLEMHNHTTCQSNLPQSRIFRRKDNLIQHLRHTHGLDSIPDVEHWKTSAPSVSSRCGFCDLRMSTWKERQDHLAGHFRKGTTMKSWKGDHGFDPSVASLVTNGLPPYLIGSESNSLVPFSATSQGTRDHFYQIQHSAASRKQRQAPPVEHPSSSLGPVISDLPSQMSTETYTQILTRHLGRYAQQQMSLGIVPTDEMFQQESRKLLYESEDTWNQTIADNLEWLGDFKANHYAGRNAEAHTQNEP